jgi:RimJ/RimL family protein N-acetyltransferase
MPDKPTLRGHGLVLRPVREDDAPCLLEATQDAENMRLTGTAGSFTLEQLRGHYRSVMAQDDRFDFAITAADDAASHWIGEAVLRNIDRHNRCAGYRISLSGPSSFGRGLGTRATRLVLDFAFGPLGMHRVELEVYDFNARARHVYEKLGFVVEGLRREALWWDGAWHNAVSMAMLAREWHASAWAEPTPSPSRDQNRK